jgi:hypothetical protein
MANPSSWIEVHLAIDIKGNVAMRSPMCRYRMGTDLIGLSIRLKRIHLAGKSKRLLVTDPMTEKGYSIIYSKRQSNQ